MLEIETVTELRLGFYKPTKLHNPLKIFIVLGTGIQRIIAVTPTLIPEVS